MASQPTASSRPPVKRSLPSLLTRPLLQRISTDPPHPKVGDSKSMFSRSVTDTTHKNAPLRIVAMGLYHLPVRTPTLLLFPYTPPVHSQKKTTIRIVAGAVSRMSITALPCKFTFNGDGRLWDFEGATIRSVAVLKGLKFALCGTLVVIILIADHTDT